MLETIQRMFSQTDPRFKYISQLTNGSKQKPKNIIRFKTIASRIETYNKYLVEHHQNPLSVNDFFEQVSNSPRGSPRSSKLREYSSSSSLSSSSGTGLGFHPEQIPVKASFGKLLIQLRKLFLENMLSVRLASSNANIPSFPVSKVSDRLSNIIVNLVSGKHPSTSDLNLLSSGEKHLYDRFMTLSGYHKNVVNTRESTKKELAERLRILEGEIEAGNSNPQLEKEIIKIARMLFEFKVITNKQLKEYIKQYK